MGIEPLLKKPASVPVKIIEKNKFMKNNSIIKMICFISDYSIWDDTIHEHACKFFDSYSIYPNLLLASKITWQKIDEYANLFNPENIKFSEYDTSNDEVNEEGIKSISSFVTTTYSLEFCLEEKANENYFILIFDEDPIFDGEPYDYEDIDDHIVYRRIA